MRAPSLVLMMMVAGCHDHQPVITVGAQQSSIERMVLGIKGTARASSRLIPGDSAAMVDNQEAQCFEVDAFNALTDERVGSAFDCLAISAAPDGLKISEVITLGVMGRGRLPIMVRTTAQPLAWPAKGFDGTEFTHVTGAQSPTNAVIVDGFGDLALTGDFRGAKGTARLSGMLDMGSLDEGYLTIDSLIVLDIKTRGR